MKAKSLYYILHQNVGISNEKSVFITLLTSLNRSPGSFPDKIYFFQHVILYLSNSYPQVINKCGKLVDNYWIFMGYLQSFPHRHGEKCRPKWKTAKKRWFCLTYSHFLTIIKSSVFWEKKIRENDNYCEYFNYKV